MSHKLAKAGTRSEAVKVIESEIGSAPDNVQEFLLQNSEQFSQFSADTQLALLSYVRPPVLGEVLRVVAPTLDETQRQQLQVAAEAWNFVRELRHENPENRKRRAHSLGVLPRWAEISARLAFLGGFGVWASQVAGKFWSEPMEGIPEYKHLWYWSLGTAAVGTAILFVPKVQDLWRQFHGPKEFLFKPIRRDFGAQVSDRDIQRALDRERLRTPAKLAAPVDPLPGLVHKLERIHSLELARRVLDKHPLNEAQRRTLFELAHGTRLGPEVRLAILEREEPGTLRKQEEIVPESERSFFRNAGALSWQRLSVPSPKNPALSRFAGGLYGFLAALKTGPYWILPVESWLMQKAPLAFSLPEPARVASYSLVGIGTGVALGELYWRVKKAARQAHASWRARQEAAKLGTQMLPAVRRQLGISCPGAFRRLDRLPKIATSTTRTL